MDEAFPGLLLIHFDALKIESRHILYMVVYVHLPAHGVPTHYMYTTWAVTNKLTDLQMEFPASDRTN